MTFHGYVGLQSRGLIALPSELRRRMHLDEPGAQVEILERGDGVIELRAALPVPADQAWFWTEHWQRREREVDEHVARGEVAVHESTRAQPPRRAQRARRLPAHAAASVRSRTTPDRLAPAMPRATRSPRHRARGSRPARQAHPDASVGVARSAMR